jgi:hypothetical protein
LDSRRHLLVPKPTKLVREAVGAGRVIANLATMIRQDPLGTPQLGKKIDHPAVKNAFATQTARNQKTKSLSPINQNTTDLAQRTWRNA